MKIPAMDIDFKTHHIYFCESHNLVWVDNWAKERINDMICRIIGHKWLAVNKTKMFGLRSWEFCERCHKMRD